MRNGRDSSAPRSSREWRFRCPIPVDRSNSQGDRRHLKTVTGAAEQGGRGELVAAVATEVAAEAKERKNPLSGFRPKGALAGQEILEELTGVNEIVSAKASADDAQAYRDWLKDAARGAADAAKEGGFFGFHAVRVSEGEQRMLDKLGEALAPPA
jgi:hypothetical protein